MNKFFKFVFDKKYRFISLDLRGYFDNLSDEAYLKKRYKAFINKKLNLKDPTTFNEKMQWLKINNRKDIYTTMADKYSCKLFLQGKGASEIIVPIVGGPWKSFDDIDFSKLPEKFVLKTTHDSGGLYVCQDKNQIDYRKLKIKFDSSMQRNYYLHGREWPYKNIPPQIFAEEYLEDDKDGVLRVYKVFNFNGIPKIIQMISNDKTQQETINYYDTEWKKINLKQNYPNGPEDEKPALLDEMLNWAKKLSRGIPFIRTDFYITHGKIYFSEFTFFSDSGFSKFYPEKWDSILGEWIIL